MKRLKGMIFRRQGVKTVTTKRQAKRLMLRKLYAVGIFGIFTLSFATLFSNVTEGEKVASPVRQVSIVSTHGKNGSAGPAGVVATAQAANGSKAVLGATTGSDGGTDSTSIPPKPSWVLKPLFNDPTNEATQYVNANPSVAGAAYFARMGQAPVAQWFGDWNANVQNDVNTYVSAAAAKGAVPQLVLYNIPNRDCGGYSVGGANGISVYTQWAQQVAAGIGNRTAIVIVEPDALGALDCLPATTQQDRLQSIAQAVTILKTHAQTAVYIDAGTAYWQSATTMASRLKAANVASADGFSLNVSYFASTAASQNFGNQLAHLIGNKHYVIDTSRNGANHAVSGVLCNPSWAAFGQEPTTNTGNALNDGLLWIKIPWESDGPCNGSPNPGIPFWSYAIQLAQNAGW
jgi:endoglucanase